MKLFAESIASASKVTVAVAPMERGSPYDRGFLEGLAEGRSSPGCDGRCEARTQGASIVPTIGATEDTASRRPTRPGGTVVLSPGSPRLGLVEETAALEHPGTFLGRDLDVARR